MDSLEMNSDLFQHFMIRKKLVTPTLSWQAATPDEHQAWRGRFAPRLRQLLGRRPDAPALQIEWVEKKETDAFTRHKIYIQSEADYWVPAYFFVPVKRVDPVPALVCLHGHSGIYPYIREGTEKQLKSSRELELDFAVRFAERGYVTIAPVQRGWNETAESVDPRETGCQRMVMNCFLTGTTPVGLRCRDASRILDFLETQECVDRKRIGAAGLSGGGMVALFLAALEQRIKLAMVAGYYCTFKDSIYSIYHCLCNCIPNMLQWGEMRDIAALIAPRPLLVISGTKDPIFPIEATRQAYAELARVYDVLGVPDKLENDFFDGPHAWSNRKAPGFLHKHFPLSKTPG